ncbi:MAG TPA: hypothetical protein VGS10_04210 [Terracidiphilus sp.]|nr:hypothetical protein [Terracidiphilus sp.]
MKLTIDNLQGAGPVDYTGALDLASAPRIVRKMNQPAQMNCVVAGAPGLGVPVIGARIVLLRTDGSFVFTGYLTEAPEAMYAGWGEAGPVYEYKLVAESDEVLLDQKVLPQRAPFIHRSAGSILKQLAQDLLPGGFDTSGVADVDTVAVYRANPQERFSHHAGEIALAARASYRAVNRALLLAPVGNAIYAIDEDDGNFSPAGLKLSSPKMPVNDLTLIGLDEPQAYVRDYFVGDGLSRQFYLSQTPFAQTRPALIDEEYAGPTLDASTWVVTDPNSAISTAAQALEVQGGTGTDGQTTVSYIQQIELGGALELQHGDVVLSGPCQGVIGGLYAGSISRAGCMAGFGVTPSGSNSNIQALVNGAVQGPVVTTKSGHRYLLTTYLYCMEVYRAEQRYHSSLHPAGSGYGGAALSANVRVVLEVQDVDPASPASLVAVPTILFDDVIANAPGFCSYALVNAATMRCSIAYTYAAHIALAQVRLALPNSSYSTQVVESLSDGGQCTIASSTSLDFYPQYVPPLNALIVASYRGWGRAVAEVVNSASITGLASGADNGVRGAMRSIKTPSARTQSDCENAALAILDDSGMAAWAGTYETWSDFLPGSAQDIFPGDGVAVRVASRAAVFDAVVRAVTIDIVDPANDRGMYTIGFANDWAEPLAYEDAGSATINPLSEKPPRLTTEQVGAHYLASLTNAQITQVSATTVSVDVGMALPSGCGVEVRMHDFGWSVSNDRNLLGRFSLPTFTLPRLARTQNYFLRLYDTSSPPRYSRYAAALHINYPL